ncbi:unnamed protein product [Rotaria sp. Silwood2]|nr:unnamed protein product [Rotaria sp. Silwood2]CAF3091649.1 unnamed protein product [Rotaria sp. Silwood2]CAF3415703.1 unnamed protein product [Rotaria sp. Silwood2]CAF4472156.1 unnamed protein product [Rotaria sp. Silwood2]CAF4763450.1 unnamed protein product [Rotaria sp. Silwood2]
MRIQKLTRLSAYLACLICFLYLMVYYSEYHFHPINDVPNSNTSIENAVQQMLTCDSGDTSRHRALLSILHAWSHFAHTYNIQYWIAYGTLVGFVQRQGLLPHDLDTDVLILSQDTKHLVPFSNAHFSPIYEIIVHPQWSFFGHENRSFYLSKGIDFRTPNARFVHRKLRYHLDIFPAYEHYSDQSQNGTDTNTSMVHMIYNISDTLIAVPVEWTFPLKACVFSGINVWCPAKPSKLVTALYGAGAVNKTNAICVNSTWVKGPMS